MGAIAAVLISVSVYRKIIREHGVYVELRKKQNEIVDEFFSLSGVKNESLPRGIQRNFQTDGPGYKGSLLIVRLSSVSVFLFCISVFLSSRDVIDFPHLSGSNQICANK